MVLIGAIISSTSTNMVWQGIVLETILEKVRRWTNLTRNMWNSDSPDRGHRCTNFYERGLSRHCLSNNFGKSGARVQNLIRNRLKSCGPDRVHHSF